MDNNANYNPECHRLRYMEHVLNLSIKAFWFGDLGGSQELLDITVVTNETRFLQSKLGTWDKVHNITVDIQSSLQSKQQLKCLAAEMLLHARNAT